MLATDLLQKLIEKKNLTMEDSHAFVTQIMDGQVNPIQTGAILTALRIKRETPDEIVGLVRAMREKMIRVDAPGAVDICGSGDGSGTFNISTAVAFVVAGAGVRVAKHGNRAATSRCGSADVLEVLGVNLIVSPKRAEKIFHKLGITFLFAPLYHPATKNVVSLRKELGVRTIFNFLGPLTSPASVKRQLIGMQNKEVAQTLAHAATQLGYDHLCIVTSDDGLDEVSICAPTTVYEVKGSFRRQYRIDPKKYGFRSVNNKELMGGNAQENAMIIKKIFEGKKGAKRDIVLLNSAFLLYIAGAVDTLKQGIQKAQDSIDSGKAKKILTSFIEETQSYE